MKKVVQFIAVLWSGRCLLGVAWGAESALTNSMASHDPVRATAAETMAAGQTNAGAVSSSVGRSESRSVLIVTDDRHRLGPGDKISFQILEDRDPPKQLTVTDSGELDVPYVGRVSVVGKTCKELAEELKGLLEKDYYYRATVVLGLDQVSRMAGRVYIWGQVRNQGAIEIPLGENFTAGKAILRAGGFTDFANRKKVRLVRTAPDGTRETLELNMENILERGKIEEDVTLRPDDFLIVPARLINW
ncbi:MAG: polysaccharide biosynthesis/export family protein [Verrucomicrobiota bacterium]|nr:polysaccharide export protein [Limisphaera sp.]MDW8380518.1 polysaccharide biosynthesis/export family protein [Verrucomicrobiota bacterium]